MRAIANRKRALAAAISRNNVVRRRLAKAVDRYKNPETGLEGWALLAAKEGRPAYWRVTDYSNSAVTQLLYWANNHSLAEGLRQTVDSLHPGKWAESLLAALVPLNRKAERELQRAKDGAYWAEAPGARRVA